MVLSFLNVLWRYRNRIVVVVGGGVVIVIIIIAYIVKMMSIEDSS